MECWLNIETTQLSVLRVFDTGKQVWGFTIYGIVSEHRNNGKTNYRFGTIEQVISMLKPYRRSVKREYQDTFDKFINETRFRLNQ